MTNRLAKLILLAMIAILALAACGSGSEDVPSLRSIEGTSAGEPTADAADGVRDAEAAMMALTECLREQGIEVYDPVVDAGGNVEKPEIVEGVDEKEVWAAWEMCEEYLEGVTFEKERVDMSEYLDQALALDRTRAGWPCRHRGRSGRAVSPSGEQFSDRGGRRRALEPG